MPTPSDYATSVFVNCPFDRQYKPLFEAILFAIVDCGFRPSCSLEIDDGSQIRVEKIFKLIAGCRFGIHDISRTDLDETSRLPRFNMPLELGIFLGAKRYGRGGQKDKVGLILDRERYRYQAFISDIAGQDIREHGDDPSRVIAIVRDWLRSASHRADIPSGSIISQRYERFRLRLPALCDDLGLGENELIFSDYTWLVSTWLKIDD
jgi:hypothetical protein